jgi:hypothetical protein
MDRNIVRKHASEIAPGILPIAPPENIPEGIFLHYLNSSGFPASAEGILLTEIGTRSSTAQSGVSRRFNRLETNLIHASHMIPDRFGGSGEKYNLIALPRQFNLSEMKRFENDLSLKMQSSKLYLQVFAAYFAPAQQIASDVLYRVFDVRNGKPAGIARDHSFLILH